MSMGHIYRKHKIANLSMTKKIIHSEYYASEASEIKKEAYIADSAQIYSKQ